MEIVPLVGLNVIKFGDFKDKSLELFGSPEYIENINGQDGVGSEVWVYKRHGLKLHFDPDYEFRLERIYIYSSDVKLQNFYPVGISEQELLTYYPSLNLEVSGGKFKDYVDDINELSFILCENIVKSIVVEPNIDEYIKKYG